MLPLLTMLLFGCRKTALLSDYSFTFLANTECKYSDVYVCQWFKNCIYSSNLNVYLESVYLATLWGAMQLAGSLDSLLLPDACWEKSFIYPTIRKNNSSGFRMVISPAGWEAHCLTQYQHYRSEVTYVFAVETFSCTPTATGSYQNWEYN